MSFSQPALLWGLGALAVPMLIHLVLRPRPRRLRFPALTLMRRALAAGKRASRVRNILLLLVRAAVLGCAALLLAAPSCTPTGAKVESGPVACVAIIDDSLSMHYRARYGVEQTLLDAARSHARGMILSSRTWPAGSGLAVISAGMKGPQLELTADPAVTATALEAIEKTPPHARPLGAAIRAAAGVLRDSKPRVRRLVILTDLTGSAWRDVDPAMLSGVDGLSVEVIGFDTDPKSNLGLIEASVPAGVQPASAIVELRVALRSTGVGGDCWIVARDGGQVLARVGPLKLPREGRREAALQLPPAPPGPHAATIELEPEDLLPFDQARYVVWQTATRPAVWLLRRDEDAEGLDASPLMIRNLLAPEALDAAEQRVTLRDVAASELIDALSASSAGGAERGAEETQLPALVVVFPGTELSPAALEALVQVVERGSAVLLVASSVAGELDWPGLRPLLARSTPVDQTLEGVTSIRWVEAADGSSGEGLDALEQCQVKRRALLDQLTPGVEVLARYVDGEAAIVSKRVGRGRVLALTTSADPLWSELGSRAGGLMTWLHQIVSESLGAPDAIASFEPGREKEGLKAVPRGGLVRVVRRGDAQSAGTWLRLDGDGPAVWPDDEVGIYAVQPAGSESVSAMYTVNWPSEEFDLTPLTEAELAGLLGTRQFTMRRVREESGAAGAGGLGGVFAFHDLAGPLGIALLVFFVSEMALATRRSSSPKRTEG